MEKQKISSAVINRLPAYLRLFTELEEKGVAHVSSNEISELMGTTTSQVRQDFSNFGGFGRQGYGYDVKFLSEQMQAILGLDKTYNLVIVGGGKIGQALANYGGYDKLGFYIKAVFDKEVWHVRVPSHIDVFDTEKLADYTSKNKIDIAIKDQAGNYVLGIDFDDNIYRKYANTRERDIHRQKYLEGRGWKVYRLWTTNWWKDQNKELQNIKSLLPTV